VEDIDEVAAELRAWVPEASFGVAHGQMSPEALEDALVTFMEGGTQVLIASAIIESGVDLPNVNTMLVNRADRFGLAQLYQLRGRVGRGSARAHCLLLVPEGLSSEAKRRVSALVENAELGAGFRLAMADLEMRGAGNLLGDAQSGNIDAVGYETWLEILEEAVQAARGEADRHRIDPEVEVPVASFLPDALYPDVTERLAMYRRLASSATEREIDEIADEVERHAGQLPPEFHNLVEATRIRLLCRELGIVRCAWLKVRVAIELHPRSPLTAERLRPLIEGAPKRWIAVEKAGVRHLDVRFLPQEAEKPFRFLRWVMAQLRAAR
jgi:transcription-repair coupling factor (superfamily II helicase)